MLKSICFGIMSDTLLCAKNISLKNSAAFSSIRKGIMYLENDPVQDKSISEIAEMCNVSESGFRRLFKLYSGYAPGEYRLNEKINRAKKLLSSHTMTVEEVSSSLGFTECGYFCKLFKKKTGVSPGKYMNMN
jgi:AraC-like DNA-binding protein